MMVKDYNHSKCSLSRLLESCYKEVCVYIYPSGTEDIFLFPDQYNKIMLLPREIMGRFAAQFSSVQLLSRVRLFATS